MRMNGDREILQVAARYFRLLSDSTRLKILHAICHEEQPVSAITRLTGCSQTNVSRNLGLMYDLAVVARRRDGTSVYYRVADSLLVDLCDAVCTRIAAGMAPSAGLAARPARPRPAGRRRAPRGG